MRPSLQQRKKERKLVEHMASPIPGVPDILGWLIIIACVLGLISFLGYWGLRLGGVLN